MNENGSNRGDEKHSDLVYISNVRTTRFLMESPITEMRKKRKRKKFRAETGSGVGF